MNFNTLLWRLWTKNKDYDIMRIFADSWIPWFLPTFSCFQICPTDVHFFFCLALNHYKMPDKNAGLCPVTVSRHPHKQNNFSETNTLPDLLA